MSTPQQRRDTAAAPAGWMILLGLMVMALLLAWASKGCGSDNNDQAGAGSTTTSPTSTAGTSTSTSAGQQVVANISDAVRKAGGIQFITGSADLTAASKTTLDAIGGILANNPSVNISVDGHTDTQGEPTANKALSQRRAQAVVDYLVQKGIATTRLNARGFGEESPLVTPDDTEAARKQNRRVEFKLSG